MSWENILTADDYRFYKENISFLESQIVQKFSESNKDPSIVSAIRKVPRHAFVNPSYKRLAYTDNAFPTYNSLTTSAPSVIAKMIYHTCVKKGDKVLEVGTGTGYQAAILSEMGINVYSLEIDKKVIQAANKILIDLGYKTDERLKNKQKQKDMQKRYTKIKGFFPNRGNIRLFNGNGQLGLPEYAPFKGIIVSASIYYLKNIKNLVNQLSDYGGRLIVPVGDRVEQLMYIIEKKNKKVRTFILKGISFQFVRMVLKEN